MNAAAWLARQSMMEVVAMNFMFVFVVLVVVIVVVVDFILSEQGMQ